MDRPQAEADARAYYNSLPKDIDANDILDPRLVREWVDARRIRPEEPVATREFMIRTELVRPAVDYLRARVAVTPLDLDDGLIWIDPAGYAVARNEKPRDWPDHPSSFDFELNVAEAIIMGEAYLRHA